MDAVALAQRLDALDIEFRRRSTAGEPVELLLAPAEELEREARRVGVADLTAVSLMRRGALLLALGRPREATAALEEARRVLGEVRKHDLGVQVLARLAEALGRQGEWRAASRVCEEGIALVEEYRYRATAQYLQTGYLRARIGLYGWGVASAHALGDHATMLERAELSKARTTLRRVQRTAPAEGGAAQWEARFRRVCAQIDQARARGEVPTRLLAERRALWDLLSMEHLGGAVREPPAFSLEAVRAALEPDEAVVYHYWIDRHRLLIATLDRERIEAEVRELDPAERRTLEEDARALLALRGVTRTVDTLLERWSGLLPRAKWLAEKRRLLVSPHLLLHALPVHALHHEGAPLLERFAVTYVPNLSSLLIPYAPSGSRAALVLGIAEYAVPGLEVQPLPTAEEQAKEVAGIYGEAGWRVRTLLGAEAREGELQRMALDGELREFGCLHLTTHGENIPSDTPMESHLYCQDSILDGLEIASWRLGAELVVLSACCAGQRPAGGRGMDELPGDEVFGLQAAFFTAGARRLVSALWPVDARVGRPILTGFHRGIAAGLPPEVALQASVNDFRRQAGINTRRAYYWASFFLAALGRTSRAGGGR